MEEWFSLMKAGTGERGIFNRGSLIHQLPERRVEFLKNKYKKLHIIDDSMPIEVTKYQIWAEKQKPQLDGWITTMELDQISSKICADLTSPSTSPLSR